MGIMKGGAAGGGGGGEIVQVEGGHIVRSTGRKDRHSKVYTSKGPRDRRVRLSAHTAIQFYDVQDRLGFDRPSKAVDWLIKKAKSSIDKLADLPPFNPTSAASSSSFMPPPPLQMEEDSDTMKLFFPASNGVPPPSVGFTGYSVLPEMVAGAPQQSQDLGLSLHPFQDSSGGLHSSGGRALFIGSTPDALDSAGCSNNNYPRMLGWVGDASGSEPNRSGPVHGFTMSHGSALMMVNPQRGPLQSSNFPGGFDEFPMQSSDNNKPQMPHGVHHHQYSSVFGGRFGPDGLTGFYFPGRAHGGDQEHMGINVSDRPSSSGSLSSGQQ